jgi:hypothetical protein
MDQTQSQNQGAVKCVAWQSKCQEAGACTFLDVGECAVTVPLAHLLYSQKVEVPHIAGKDTYLCVMETDGAAPVAVHGDAGMMQTLGLCTQERLADRQLRGMLRMLPTRVEPAVGCDGEGEVPILMDDGTILCKQVLPK